MNQDSFQNLLQALKLSPSNAPLRGLTLDAALTLNDLEALEAVLSLAGADALDSDARLSAALQAFVAANRHDLIMAYTNAESAENKLAQARALFASDKRSEAIVLYRCAIEMNPALEDAVFSAQLSGKIVSLSGARADKVASIANDDTSNFEMARWVEPVSTRVTFADVGGLDEVKKEIRRRIITPFVKPSLFQRFKRSAGGGILMYGPPGCGKTLLARATAGECGAKFYNVSITDVLDMYIGESERKLHQIFEQARRNAPAVLFFDEVEAIGGKRQHAREATSAKLVSQFLTELDGFAQNNGQVLVLGATNVPWAIDPAFRRPGRFDRVLFVPPPDAPARQSILQVLLRDRPVASDIDLRELVKKSSSFSGADLRHLIDTAADEAIEESMSSAREVSICMSHLRCALEQVRPTTLEWLTSARNHARYANESGQYDEVLKFLEQHQK